MDIIEITDPDGDALTLFLEDELIWITCTSGREEVTIGPLPSHLVRHSLLSTDDPLGAALTMHDITQHQAPPRPEESAELVAAAADGAPPHLEIVAEGSADPAPLAGQTAPRDQRQGA